MGPLNQDLLQLFPMAQRDFWKRTAAAQEQIQEIRMRKGKPVIVLWKGQEWFLDSEGNFTDKPDCAHCVEEKEMEALLNHICHYSPYAFGDEIRQGFVTVAGGHRVGLAGQVVLENQTSVRTIKHISYLNIRISHQVKGAADKILPFVYKNGCPKNTLIISPPGCGKTTLLRDMIRQISDGNAYGKGMSVGVVDERSEIAGSYLGLPQNDVGMRTDVLDACPKALGMMLLLRSMSPRVIAIDEIGDALDMKALHQAASCGSRIVATIHGEGIEDYIQKFSGCGMEQEPLFECFIVLGKENGHPVIKKMMGRKELYASFNGGNSDSIRLSGNGLMVPGELYRTTGNFAESAADSGAFSQ